MRYGIRLLFLGLVLLSHALQAQVPNILAWGDNTYGQTNVPPDLTNAVAVAAGDGFSMALTSDGRVLEWGLSNYLQRPLLSNVVAITAGRNRYAITTDAYCYCWGQSFPSPYILTNVTKVSLQSRSFVPADTEVATVLTTSGGLRRYRFSPNPASYSQFEETQATGYLDVAATSCGVFGLNPDRSASPVAGLVTAYYSDCPFSTRSLWWDPIYTGISNINSMAAMGFRAWLPPLTFAAITSGGLVQGGTIKDCVNIPNGCTSMPVYDATGTNIIGWTGPWQIPYPIVGVSNALSLASGESAIVAVLQDGRVVTVAGSLSIPADLPFTYSFAVGSSHNLAIVQPGVPTTPPSILQQPTPPQQTVPIGSQASIRAIAAGYPPLTYQWYFNQTNLLQGANFPQLHIPNAQPIQSGAYTLVISNPVGSVTSAPAHLSVAPLLNAYTVPAIQVIGGTGFTYQLEYIRPIGPTGAWIYLDTLTLSNSPQFYFDTSAIGQPERFYRARQQP